MLLFRQDGPYIAQLIEGNSFTTATRSRMTTNLNQEVREGHTLTKSIAAFCSISERDAHSITSSEVEFNDGLVPVKVAF